MIGILVALASATALADAEAATGATKRCDLPAFQAAVERIEDRAFLSMKAANEAVATAARAGSVGDAGDAEWAHYKALRAEAERLRFENARALGNCSLTAQTGPVAPAGGVSATQATTPLTVEVTPPQRWALTYELSGGEVSADTGQHMLTSPSLASVSTNIRMTGTTSQLALGALWRERGPDAQGWSWSGGIYLNRMTADGSLPSLPSPPGNNYYYVYVPDGQPLGQVRLLSESALWQKVETFGASTVLGRRFEIDSPVGAFHIEPSVSLGIGRIVLEENERLHHVRSYASVPHTRALLWWRDYAGVRGDASLRIDVGGRLWNTARFPEGVRWIVAAERGLAGFDLDGLEVGATENDNGVFVKNDQMVRPLSESADTWTLSLNIAFDLTPDATVKFGVSRVRDVFISTPLSSEIPANSTDIWQHRRIELRPLDATLYSLSLDYRF